MTDLSSLISRVEKATGPDRGLDAEISAVLEPHLFDAPGFTPERPIPSFRYDPSENVIRFDGGGIMDVRFFPPVTSSIDAAVSLAERVLPGWGWGITHGSEKEEDIQGNVFPKQVPMPAHLDCYGYHRVPAIALVLATLRAVQSQTGEA